MVRYLLLIDATGNVILRDTHDDIQMPIGPARPPDSRTRVTTAVWSPGGQWTAWAVGSDDPGGLHEVRIHIEDTDDWRVLVEEVRAFYLCPSPCGRFLSHLSMGPLGLELAISDVATGHLQVIERGQPLFWSWAPDSSALAVHVEDRVAVMGLDGSVIQPITDSAGPFVAPWWLPGGTVVFGDENRIVAAQVDGTKRTLVAHGSSGRFAVAPDGRRLAFVRQDENGAALLVVDLLTGVDEVVTEAPIASFFWSPDGERLAVLVAGSAPGAQWLVTGVDGVDGNGVDRLDAFRPSRSVAGSVLPFFEQYAQSHAVWSDDGSQLVMAAIDPGGASRVLVQSATGSHESSWMSSAELVWWA